MANGNPRCLDCAGRGGSLHHGRWFACPCVKPRANVLRMLRDANGTRGNEYRSVTERDREQREGK